MPTSTLSVVLVGALVQVCGCKRRAPRVDKEKDASAKEAPAEVAVAKVAWVVPAVQLELHAVQTKERDLDAAGLSRRLGSRLRASDHFIPDASEAPAGFTPLVATVAARLSYDVIKEGSTGSPAIIVALEVALIPNSSENLAVSDNVIIERVIGATETPAQVDAAIAARAQGAIDASADGLLAKEELRAANRAALAKAMKGPPDIALWALDITADRRDVGLVDDVISQLKSRDPRVVSAAITTSVALGSPAAVGPMTKMADFQDYEQIRVLIEATSVLGGNDAIEFLDFVSTGHPDDSIKKQATEALRRLRP